MMRFIYHWTTRFRSIRSEKMDDRGDREMYDAVCSDCGQPCKVPFKPTEGRPVYCRDCFKKRRGF